MQSQLFAALLSLFGGEEQEHKPCVQTDTLNYIYRQGDFWSPLIFLQGFKKFVHQFYALDSSPHFDDDIEFSDYSGDLDFDVKYKLGDDWMNIRYHR